MRKVIPLQQPVASVKGTTTLNEQQLATIQDLQGFHAINAGPGTGKSATLIARLFRIREVYPLATVLSDGCLGGYGPSLEVAGHSTSERR